MKINWDQNKDKTSINLDPNVVASKLRRKKKDKLNPEWEIEIKWIASVMVQAILIWLTILFVILQTTDINLFIPYYIPI